MFREILKWDHFLNLHFKCHNSVFFVVLFYLQVSRPGYVLRDGGQLCCFEKQEIQKINQGHLWFGKSQLQWFFLESRSW